MNKSDLVSLRDGCLDDTSFIFSTWLKGLRFGNDWFGMIHQDTYFARYHDVIDAILKHPSTKVRVACLADDPDIILGYAVYSGTKAHWLFVKKAWRNIGIAKSLLPDTITQVTHVSNVGKTLLAKRPSIQFNPFDLL